MGMKHQLLNGNTPQFDPSDVLKKWCDRLNGREYRSEMIGKEEDEAFEDRVLIIFGYSDDLIEFRGLVNEECGAWNGRRFFISDSGSIHDIGKVATRPKNENVIGVYIDARWSPCHLHPEASWMIEANCPFRTFNILEDGTVYCVGIVIHESSLKKVWE